MLKSTFRLTQFWSSCSPPEPDTVRPGSVENRALLSQLPYRTFASSVGLLALRQACDLHDRPDLDRAPAHPRDAGGDVDRLVEIRGVDQVVATELFSCLGERTVGYQPFTVAHADAGRGRRQVK